MDNVKLKTIINNIELRNFRCFEDKKINLNAPLTIIQGMNGSGKTSLVEALYFAGNIRSCKTAYIDHLIKQNERAFFLKVCFSINTILYIGAEQNKKIIKIDQKNISSLKEIKEILNVISIIENDMLLIQGGPAERRLFLDEALLLCNNDLFNIFKKLKIVIKNRNDFLARRTQNETLYDILTEQLIESSLEVQRKRIDFLEQISLYLNKLIDEFQIPLEPIIITYKPKVDLTKPNASCNIIQECKNAEYAQGRSLFGAHLDDFSIYSGSLDARKHCSRGQQKLIIILLKIGLLKVCNTQSQQILLLIDDFITDFDQKNMLIVMKVLLSLECQLILTSPLDLLLKEYIPTSVESLIVNL